MHLACHTGTSLESVHTSLSVVGQKYRSKGFLWKFAHLDKRKWVKMKVASAPSESVPI